MRDAIYLLFHLLTTLAKLVRPGGSRTVIAENLILKQQLIKTKSSLLRPSKSHCMLYRWLPSIPFQIDCVCTAGGLLGIWGWVLRVCQNEGRILPMELNTKLLIDNGRYVRRVATI